MGYSRDNSPKAWGWAFALNLVIFSLIWFGITRMPAPVQSEINQGTTPDDLPVSIAQTPDLPVSVIDPEDISSQPEDIAAPPTDSPLSVLDPDILEVDPGEDSEPSAIEPAEQPGQWIDEFYLDRGPVISLAPRVNPDGSPRTHPLVDDRPKAPTYEDRDDVFNIDEYTLPKMNPQVFSRMDLPEEYREMDFDITVRLHIDARGRLLGTPEFKRRSGIRAVDNLVIEKLMNEVTFEASRHKVTGTPITVYIRQPIFFEDPSN